MRLAELARARPVAVIAAWVLVGLTAGFAGPALRDRLVAPERDPVVVAVVPRGAGDPAVRRAVRDVTLMRGVERVEPRPAGGGPGVVLVVRCRDGLSRGAADHTIGAAVGRLRSMRVPGVTVGGAPLTRRAYAARSEPGVRRAVAGGALAGFVLAALALGAAAGAVVAVSGVAGAAAALLLLLPVAGQVSVRAAAAGVVAASGLSLVAVLLPPARRGWPPRATTTGAAAGVAAFAALAVPGAPRSAALAALAAAGAAAAVRLTLVPAVAALRGDPVLPAGRALALGVGLLVATPLVAAWPARPLPRRDELRRTAASLARHGPAGPAGPAGSVATDAVAAALAATIAWGGAVRLRG